MRAAIAAACVLLVGAACSDDAPGLTPTPTPPATIEGTPALPSPATRTPAPATATAPSTPTPRPGVPFPLVPFEVDTHFVAGDDPEGVGWPFIVDLDTHDVRRWVGAYALAPSPFEDIVLATVEAGPLDGTATALLDLSTGEVEGLLPVGASVLRWPEQSRLFVLIDPLNFGQLPNWLAGIYELDLDARTIELVSRGGGGRSLSPDGSMTLATSVDAAPGIVVRELTSGEAIYSYLAKDTAGSGALRLWSAS